MRGQVQASLVREQPSEFCLSHQALVSQEHLQIVQPRNNAPDLERTEKHARCRRSQWKNQRDSVHTPAGKGSWKEFRYAWLSLTLVVLVLFDSASHGPDLPLLF